MTETEKRETFFDNWRAGISEEDFEKCSKNMSFLLTSIDNHSDSWVLLVDYYNDKFEALLAKLLEIKEEYNRDKRLSKGFQAAELQKVETLNFWVDIHNEFYQEFKRRALIQVTK